MHDPMVEAFSIRRPWPEVRKLNREYKPTLRGVFWRFWGLEFYWPSLVTVWHVEPDGQDAGTVCKPSTWRRHPRHWKIQFHPWQHFRRWAFTRCAWCGGKSRKGDRVNVSYGWEPDRKLKHWWQGERGIFHQDCISIEHAHRTCVCSLVEGGPWKNGNLRGDPYGDCGTCGGFRRMATWSSADYEAHVATVELMKRIPKGERDDVMMGKVREIWKTHRATWEANDA